jgi:threonine/homoserine/homoserine lactone efflux protein
MDASAMSALAQSILIGLSVAAPIGPIGLLTIQRSIDRGWTAGLATGMGAAVADGIYAAVGAFGTAALVSALAEARTWLTMAGIAFLIYLAWDTWRRQSVSGPASTIAATELRCFLGTLLLTLSNPLTILFFVGVFTSMSLVFASSNPWLMVLGVFAGSSLWWVLLALGISRLRDRFDSCWRQRIRTGSALLLVALAGWQLVTFLGTELPR